ncbi:MAG: nicotinate (nicotinamide) nucleotide adenylyltransferase [Campylobacterales bacterium]|nr:nicotinate (nicotinamide) nucleotide adenylyltransferase [Campylobacterales bacterium]
MNVAIFGGSFDPIHVGHVDVVERALKMLDIDMLFIIPTYLNPFKDSFFAPPFLRLKWCEKVFKNYKNVKILDIEISKNRKVTTYETVLELKKIYDISKIYLIVGADNLQTLNKWFQYEELLKMVKVVVANRKGYNCENNFLILDSDIDISSSFLREHFDIRYIPDSIKQIVEKFYKTRVFMENRVKKIVALLEEKKAEEVAFFDLRGKDYFVDFVVVATTLADKHGFALLNYLKDNLRKEESFLHVDESDDWVVVDMGDILIHLMSQKYREKYNLEDFLESIGKKK